MVEPARKFLSFLTTTALGGLVFLLPLIVIGALLGQLVQVIVAVAKGLSEVLPIDSARAWMLLILLAIAVLLGACFVAGFVARWTFGKRLSAWMEKNLTMFFPRYLIVKARMAGTLGGDAQPNLKPVLVHLHDMSRMAFEVERTDSGRVTVYFPGSPDPWNGVVGYVAEERVEPLALSFSSALECFEKIGHDSGGKVFAERVQNPAVAAADRLSPFSKPDLA